MEGDICSQHENVFTLGQGGRHAGGSESWRTVGDTPSHKQRQTGAFSCECKMKFSVAGRRAQPQHSGPFILVSPTFSALLFVTCFLISSPFLNKCLYNILYSCVYPISLVWVKFLGESEVRNGLSIFSCRQISYDSLLT